MPVERTPTKKTPSYEASPDSKARFISDRLGNVFMP
jgi:hypothetical protein